MVYCSNCGEKISDDALFCPKCCTKTPNGKASNTPYPSDELRDAFYQIGIELERAFNIAAHETHQAIKRAKGNIQQKPTVPKESFVCPNCGTKNPSGAAFCNNCGTKLAFTKESHGST